MKLLVEVRDIHKAEKKNSIGVSGFCYENKEKHSIYVSKKCCEGKRADLLLVGEEGKRHFFLINDLMLSCMTIYYILEGSIFVVIVYKLSDQKKYQNVILKAASNLIAKKGLYFLKLNILNSK